MVCPIVLSAGEKNVADEGNRDCWGAQMMELSLRHSKDEEETGKE